MELLSPASYMEKHVLSDSEDVVRFAFGKNVVLNISQDISVVRQRDSARANSRILTDYKWENKANYSGRILAVRDKLVAYRLFNENTGEAVRVLERETRARHLIKDFRHPTVDLQWAVHAPFLAVLDINCNLYVYHVDEKCNSLVKYLNIIRDEPPTNTTLPKITWCPYTPDDELDADKDMHLLSVSSGNVVDMFFLHNIKAELRLIEVKYEQLAGVSDVHINLDMDSEVMCVRLSPDATAIAVATMDCHVSFYVIDNGRTRFANRVRPLPNNYVEEIIFLDNLSNQNQEQFWKSVVLSSDSGRRLSIFDCDTWQCMGKLRFELPNQITRFEFSIDSTAHFLFMADYDNSCLYCLEMDYTSGQPCFSACTQITFCNPLVCIVPCGLDKSDDCDLTLDDEDLSSCNSFVSTFVAITHRSLIELAVDLERHQIDPTAFIRPASREVDEAHVSEAIDRPPFPPEEILATHVAVIAGKHQQLADNNHSKKRPSSTSSSSNIGGSSGRFSKFINTFEDKFTILAQKVDDLHMDVEKLQQENRNLRDEQTDNLSNALEKISNEFKSQADRIESSVSKLNAESREQLVRAVEAALSSNAVNLQSMIEVQEETNLEVVRSTVHQLLVPAVEGVCTQLFRQLNETFRDGLQEFMDQLKQQQSYSGGGQPLSTENISNALKQISTDNYNQLGNVERSPRIADKAELFFDMGIEFFKHCKKD